MLSFSSTICELIVSLFFSNIVRLVAPNGIFKVSLIIIISTNTTKAEIVLTLKNSVQLKFQKTLQTT